MPTIPSIKQVFASSFNEEFPPKNVFVLLNGEVVSVTREQLNTIDDAYYNAGFDDKLQLTIIAKKGK